VEGSFPLTRGRFGEETGEEERSLGRSGAEGADSEARRRGASVRENTDEFDGFSDYVPSENESDTSTMTRVRQLAGRNGREDGSGGLSRALVDTSDSERISLRMEADSYSKIPSIHMKDYRFLPTEIELLRLVHETKQSHAFITCIKCGEPGTSRDVKERNWKNGVYLKCQRENCWACVSGINASHNRKSS